MVLKVKKLHPDAQLPYRATAGAAGADLSVCCGPQGITLAPMERALIPTGIAIELPGPQWVAYIFNRSSMGLKKGIVLPNGVGVIDSDYRGELSVAVLNLSGAPYTFQCGERIAQLVVMPVEPFAVEETLQLGQTIRGAGGFGSTGG